MVVLGYLSFLVKSSKVIHAGDFRVSGIIKVSDWEKKASWIVISDRIFPTKLMKCVIFPIYRLPKQNMCYFLDSLSEKLDFYSEHYANIYILGDFNSTPSNPRLTLFFGNQHLKNLLKIRHISIIFISLSKNSIFWNWNWWSPPSNLHNVFAKNVNVNECHLNPSHIDLIKLCKITALWVAA